jgi:diguanylate cyclase
MAGGSAYEPSMAIAAVAFQQMQAFRHAATPPNYEIWYNYANASNPALNQAINDLLAGQPAVTQNDLDGLHETFFSPTRLGDQMDAFGAQVIGEIDQIMTMIDGTLDSTMRHAESLVDMSSQINDTNDLNALRGIITKLVQTARDI